MSCESHDVFCCHIMYIFILIYWYINLYRYALPTYGHDHGCIGYCLKFCVKKSLMTTILNENNQILQWPHVYIFSKSYTFINVISRHHFKHWHPSTFLLHQQMVSTALRWLRLQMELQTLPNIHGAQTIEGDTLVSGRLVPDKLVLDRLV